MARCHGWSPRALVVALGLAAACTGAAPNSAPSESDAVASLRAADSALQAAIAAREAGRTAEFYATDAVMLPVQEPIVEGRAAIREEWDHVFGIPGYASRIVLVAAVTSRGGDFGYTRGTYESPMLGPDGREVIERGKWVSIWRRDADGQWRVVVDTYNTDTPPPDHQPSTSGHSAQ